MPTRCPTTPTSTTPRRGPRMLKLKGSWMTEAHRAHTLPANIDFRHAAEP